MLSKAVVSKLKELDNSHQRLRDAVAMNTKHCPFDQQEQMQERYYLRRSSVLMKIQTDRPEDEILDFLKVAIDATMVEVELWEKTKVKK